MNVTLRVFAACLAVAAPALADDHAVDASHGDASHADHSVSNFHLSNAPSLTFGYEGAHLSSGGFSDTEHELFLVGTYPVAPNFSLGLGAAVRVSPDAAFDRLVARGIYEAAVAGFPGGSIGFTADAGTFRYEEITITPPDVETINGKYGGIFGLGLRVAIPIPGSPVTLFTQRPWTIAPLAASLNFADDILTIAVAGNTFGTLGLPVGALFAITPQVGVSVRTGIRHAFGFGTGATFIPLGADVVFNATDHLHLVASVELPGNTDAYTDLITFGAHVGISF